MKLLADENIDAVLLQWLRHSGQDVDWIAESCPGQCGHLVWSLSHAGSCSIGLLAEMLGMGVIEADEWLARRGISLNYAPEDLDADRRDLQQLFPEVGR